MTMTVTTALTAMTRYSVIFPQQCRLKMDEAEEEPEHFTLKFLTQKYVSLLQKNSVFW